VEFLEWVKKIVVMFNAHIINIKIIHNEAELKGLPLVAPEARCGSSFIETLSNKVGSK